MRRLIQSGVTVLFVLLFLSISHSAVQAAVVTWDGEGTDGTCGGVVGDGNKWSCGANWSTNAIPTSADVATFDGTNTKDATIDANITVVGIDINTGYTGTITQAAAITLTTSGFAQDAGTFAGGSQAIDINDGSFTLGAGADFTATSGTLSIERNLTINSSASFTHNSGTIVSDGAGTYEHSVITCGSKSFNFFIISKNHTLADFVAAADCALPLGDNAVSIAGEIINYGSITVGTGTWTVQSEYSQTTAGSSLSFSGTTINARGFSGEYTNGSFALINGTFSAPNLTTLFVEGSLNNSADLLPTGLDVTLNATYSILYADGIITCSGNEAFNSFTIEKHHYGADVTIGSACNIHLGDNPIVYAGVITNNGSVTVGTGTWTLNAVYVQNSAGASTTFTGTTIDANDRDGTVGYPGYITLSAGSFSAPNLTTLTAQSSINNSGNLLPSGIDVTLDGHANSHDATITCSGNENFGSFTIQKSAYGADVILQPLCNIYLGDNPTVNGGVVTNNGTLSAGTGIWTLNASYVQNTAGASTSFDGTTMYINNRAGTSGYVGSLTLSGGSFTATNMTTLRVRGSLNNSGDLLPTGLDVTLDASDTYSDGVITCSGNENFNSFTIDKSSYGADVTLQPLCNIDLGDNPTVSGGVITNNGSLSVGTGIWTLNASYIQSNPEATTAFNGTKIDVNDQASSPLYTGNVTLTGGTLTATNMTSIDVQGSLDNSGNKLPTNLALLLDGSHGTDDSTVTCSGSESYSSITLNKTSSSADTTFASSCTTVGNFTRIDGPILNSASLVTLTVQGNLSMSTVDAFGGSNLNIRLSGSNSQAISKNATNTFSSPIQIDKTGGNAASLATSFTSTSATCTVVEGILNTAGNAFACGSTFTVEDGGTVLLDGNESVTTPNLASGSTVGYNGATGPYTVNNWNYHHLRFNGSGGTFTSPTTLNIAGNFINSAGTFNANSGTVILNGSNQSISGDTTFNNLTKSTVSTDTLTFAAGSTQTIGGTLTLGGASSNLLSLRSSVPGTQWEIDPQGTRTISYLDVQDSNNINVTTIDAMGTNSVTSGNNTNWTFTNPATVSPLSSITQSTSGDGLMSFVTTVSDVDLEDTRLKVEYSDDGGTSWYTAYIRSATPSQGSVDVDNVQAYQVGSVNPIDTSLGTVTLTLIWDTQHASNGNGSLIGTHQNDIQLRLTANDLIADGASQTSSSFNVDNLAPSIFSNLTSVARTMSAIEVTWTAATEDNFDHYEVWYGTNQADVESRTGTALAWDNLDDALLSSLSTIGTTITGLVADTLYWMRAWAVDLFGNELASNSMQISTLSPTPTPTSTPTPTATSTPTPTATATPTPTATVTSTPSASSGGVVSGTSSSSSSSNSVVPCTATVPGSKAPLLYAAITQNSSEIMLYFAPGDGPFDHYRLAYGRNSDARGHGVESISSDLRTFTVSALDTNTTYYFQIRSGNGCATGSWSEVISGTTQSLVPLFTLQTTDISRSSISSRPTPTVSPKVVLEIPESTPTKTVSAKEDVVQAYVLTLKLLDDKQQPLAGVAVELHSKVQTGVTNKRGEVIFKDVEPGEHMVAFNHEGYESKQSIVLSGEDEHIIYTLAVRKQFPYEILVLGILFGSVSTTILILWYLKKDRLKQKMSSM